MGEGERVLERFAWIVLYRVVKSVCMRGGPGWDLARGRPDGVQSIGVANGISVCEESRSSGVGTMEAGIAFSSGRQTRGTAPAYLHLGMVRPGRVHRGMQFVVLHPHCTHP